MLSRVDEPNFITTTKQENSTSTTTTSRSRSKDPRIVRVSRALGGKDRHSKVCTVRGLRDRRVRLSVPTAIQLYDLQDRLGLNQPSKVVDWLLNAAKHDIDELPPLQFPPGSLVNPNFHPMMSNFQEFASSHQSDKQGLIMSKDHVSCQTSSPIEDVTRFNLQNQGELNNFNSIPSYNSFVRSSSSWDHDPSSLTLNHDYQPSISLGLRAHHQNHDLHSFGFLQSGPPGLQSSNQVLVYHQQLGMNTTQPYFTQTNMGFEPKGSTNYQTPSDISNHVIRPFQFRMAANLLPSQCNALNEENKRD